MSLLGDVVPVLRMAVLPAVVGVDVCAWVVSVGPSTVQAYKQSVPFYSLCVLYVDYTLTLIHTKR